MFHGRAVPYRKERTILQLFEEQAARTPDAAALAFGEQRLNYGELNGKANTLARQMRRHGIGAGDFVPLVMGNGPALPVAMIASMKLNAPFVPLDELWPRPRLAALIDGMGPKLVLNGTDVDVAKLERSDDNDFGPPARTDDLIYGFYTSGSTGIPKCALNRHLGLLNRFTYMTRRFGDGPDVVLQNSRHVFDSSIWQLLWPLTNGNEVVIPERTGLLDLAATVETIRAHRITMTDFVPTIFNALVELLLAEPERAEHLATLRHLLIGGEEMDARSVHAFRSLLPQTTITNTYGPTEASIGSIFHEVTTADGESIPIGRPIDNTFAVIVDDNMQPVPPGEIGHIHLGGDCLGAGYLGDPERTAEAFVANPFPQIPGDTLYRTGDMGYYRTDGLIAFSGRRDRQVKIEGIRVDLLEVENAVTADPRVRGAKVIFREVAGRKVLTAFVTLRAPLTIRQLTRSAAKRLPHGLVPKQFVVLDELPLTPNGKLDRRRLAELADRKAEPDSAELTADQRAVQAIWLALLPVGSVHAQDNFFECGGDSLAAQRLALALRARFGRRITVNDIIAAPTLADQADLAGGRVRAPSYPAASAALSFDARLPSDIQGNGVRAATPPRHVLLTGPTGFVGAQLLHDLLERTGADVVCLVRASDPAEARARVISAMDRYGWWNTAAAERVTVVRGDLELARVGLEADEYARLAEKVDAIVHNGASVNMVTDYGAHRAANVLGTVAMLRLAATGRPKHLHHVSTLSVFPPGNHTVHPEAPAGGTPPTGGYSASKWVAEQLVDEAARRGLPVTVYRLGEVMPHSRHGVPNERALIHGLITACLRLGTSFASPITLDYTPLEQVGEFIVTAVRLGRTGYFHVAQPHAVRLDDVFERFRERFGWRVSSYADFWQLLSGQSGDEELARLLAALPEPEEANLEALFTSGPAGYASGRARAFMAETGMSPPPVTARVFDRYAAYCAAAWLQTATP